jgi:hypothetical protein
MAQDYAWRAARTVSQSTKYEQTDRIRFPGGTKVTGITVPAAL